MARPDELRASLRKLFEAQKFAVLSTQRGGQPFGNLVAFAVTSDLARLVFATRAAGSKYHRILDEARVALLVDNRSNREADFREAVAVTALGEARAAEGADREDLAELFLSRHPSLRSFVDAQDCALVSVDVARYLVSGFREVEELRLR